eukprot:SAG31_NODE_22922_length_515_cov_0.975962_1_plen_77_part_00
MRGPRARRNEFVALLELEKKCLKWYPTAKHYLQTVGEGTVLYADSHVLYSIIAAVVTSGGVANPPPTSTSVHGGSS